MEYVYILQEREFVRLNEPTYKIGRTGQKNPFSRVRQYSKNSKVIMICAVNDSVAVENSIKTRFGELFEQRREYGLEYFTGDVAQMQIELNAIVTEHLGNEPDLQEYSSDSSEDDIEDDDNIIIDPLPVVTITYTPVVTKAFKCDKCSNSFKDKYNLRRHQNRKTSCVSLAKTIKNPENTCLLCKNSFATKGSLTRHYKTCDMVQDPVQLLLKFTSLYNGLEEGYSMQVQGLQAQIQGLQAQIISNNLEVAQ